MAQRPKPDRLTVLVVDDEWPYRDALSQELECEYEVIAAPGAEEAFEIVGKRSDLAAVVTDLVMRGPADGYALLEGVRLLRPACARILVSSTSEGDWFLRNGTAQRFVRKPWKTGAVLAALWEVVG